MPEYVRVRDLDTGHELSVPESSVPHGRFEVLDQPAGDHLGALPPKHAAPKSLSSKTTTSGQQADSTKEK